MNDDHEYEKVDASLVVSFDDQSESFTHGFEAGIIWKRMMDGEVQIDGCNGMMCHEQNITVFRRMALAQQYDMEISYSENEWVMPVFIKARHRFTVVDGGVQ